jgi:hypothetical protein
MTRTHTGPHGRTRTHAGAEESARPCLSVGVCVISPQARRRSAPGPARSSIVAGRKSGGGRQQWRRSEAERRPKLSIKHWRFGTCGRSLLSQWVTQGASGYMCVWPATMAGMRHKAEIGRSSIVAAPFAAGNNGWNLS